MLHRRVLLRTPLLRLFRFINRHQFSSRFNSTTRHPVALHSFMKRQHHQQEEVSKRVRIMINQQPNHVEPSFHKHNNWRRESIHNPRYRTLEQQIKLKNVDNRLMFHKSLPKQQHYSIDISDEEKLIFDFLLEVNEHYKLGTTLRVAGGWIRNKLLGIFSDDIDIALDNMLGKEFAEHVTKHAKLKGMREHTVGVIEARPEQSKHLETATTHIYGQAIDFVNLRCEEYADQDSRIPTSMRLGTPLEDAMRRDLTINSLFYNLNTRTVEDFSGRGMQDLQLGLVETPLPPRSTLLDDPLRVLRAVRFAVTFNFLVVDDLIEAAQLVEVHDALAEKVSRERVGTELSKMMKGSDPVGAMALIRELGILDVVFTTCNHFAMSRPVKKKTHQKHILTQYLNPQPIPWTLQQWKNTMFRMRVMYRDAQDIQLKGEDRMVLMIAAALSGCIDLSKYDMIHIHEYCDNVIQSSLRLSSHLASSVATVMYGAHRIHQALNLDQDLSDIDMDDLVTCYQKLIQGEKRLVVGKWLREDVKRLYKMALLLANVIDTSGNELDEVENDRTYGGSSARAKAFIQALSRSDQGKMADHVIDMKTILNGTEIAAFLKIRPGKVLTIIIEEMFDWQIAQTEEHRTKHAAEQWLDTNRERYLELNQQLQRK
jgi:tRNA nucleotidyltransferase/poly(A) polymerase